MINGVLITRRTNIKTVVGAGGHISYTPNVTLVVKSQVINVSKTRTTN